MQKSILFTVITFLFLTFSASAQNVKKGNKYYSKGQTAIRNRDLNSAESYLKESILYNPTSMETYLALGDVYYIQKNYSNALVNYYKADSISPQYYLKYKLANAYFYTSDYKNAKLRYLGYLKKAPSTNKGVLIAKKRIDNCDFAIEAMKNPVAFNPINLGKGINTQGFEYNPVVSVDGGSLIYTGIRLKNNKRVEDFYVSEFKNGEWQKGIPLPGYVNSNRNEGAHCISMDGKFLFFTSCGRQEGYGSCDIYVAQNLGGYWSEPVNLGGTINSSAWDAHPAISPDGNRLMFTSSRRGGKGGKDLWMSEYSNNTWSTPLNVKEINTKGNELTPFLHVDGSTLYFSSDGYRGMGGIDFFVSYYNDSIKKWSTPINLGYGINSPGDEYSLMVARDGKTAYFSTDALKGAGEMDVYTFMLGDNARGKSVAYLNGNVKDIVGKQNISNSSISIVDLKTSKAINAISISEGVYTALLPVGETYAAVAMAPGYVLQSETFEFIADSLGKSVNRDFYLSKLTKGKTINLNNVNFNSGKSELLTESFFELDIVVAYLKQHSKYKVKINGHTDNVGNKTNNMILSKNRALSVLKYFKLKGVETKRMKSFGFGETKPIDTNETELGRKKNRRTEILLY